MSRSEYGDCDGDQWQLIKWRGAVVSALRGKRGQAFLRELRDALDALPVKRLIKNDLESGGEVCALGAVGRARGTPMAELDPEDHETIAGTFGISNAMAREIMYLNDEYSWSCKETPEERYERMRRWVEAWTS
jgi:hypothetical protein